MRTARSVGAMAMSDDEDELVLRHLDYLGTHPTAPRELGGVDVVFAYGGIAFTRKHETLGAISWAEVCGLSAVEERLPGRINWPAVLLVGVLGFLFRGAGRRVVLRVSDRRGDWLFDVPGIKIDELRLGLAQIRRRHTKGR